MCSYQLMMYAIFVMDNFLNFCSKFFAMVYDNLYWPTITCQLAHFQYINDIICSFRKNLSNFKTSCCWIYYSQTVEKSFILFLTNFVQTCLITTESVLGFILWIFRRQFAILLISDFIYFIYKTFPIYLLEYFSYSFRVIILSQD